MSKEVRHDVLIVRVVQGNTGLYLEIALQDQSGAVELWIRANPAYKEYPPASFIRSELPATLILPVRKKQVEIRTLTKFDGQQDVFTPPIDKRCELRPFQLSRDALLRVAVRPHEKEETEQIFTIEVRDAKGLDRRSEPNSRGSQPYVPDRAAHPPDCGIALQTAEETDSPVLGVRRDEARLQSPVSVLRAELEEVRNELDAAITLAASLRVTLEATEENAFALQIDCRKLQTGKDALEARVASFTDEISHLKDQLAETHAAQRQAEEAQAWAMHRRPKEEGPDIALERARPLPVETGSTAGEEARRFVEAAVRAEVRVFLNRLHTELTASRPDLDPTLAASLCVALGSVLAAEPDPATAACAHALGERLAGVFTTPLQEILAHLDTRDLVAAIRELASFLDHRREMAMGSPTLEEVEADLRALAFQAWDGGRQPAVMAAVEQCLALLGMQSQVPEVGQSYNVAFHRPTTQERPAEGRPRNRVLVVERPGVLKNGEVVEKAHVRLS